MGKIRGGRLAAFPILLETACLEAYTEHTEKVPGCLGFIRSSPVIYCFPRVSANSAFSILHSTFARYCAAPQAGQNFAPSLRGALQALQTGAAFC